MLGHFKLLQKVFYHTLQLAKQKATKIQAHFYEIPVEIQSTSKTVNITHALQATSELCTAWKARQ